MNQEIERKFLVKNEDWKGKAEPVLYRQGYIARTVDRVVRVRVAGEKGKLTIKVRIGEITRMEYEYDIPLEDAHHMLNSLAPGEIIEKNRYTFADCGHVWEVDEFLGANDGLVVAEVELSDENEKIVYPPWLGKEVSKISRYLNVQLVQQPYETWKVEDKNKRNSHE